MKKQTAVEWLIDNWIKFNDIDIELDDFANLRPLLKQAKRMEEEQQMELLKFSREMCTPDAPIDYVINEFSKYYNETFNTKQK